MITIPAVEFNLPKYDDPNLVRSWEWFMSFIPVKKWKERKETIEKSISLEFKDTLPFSEPISKGTAIAIKDDKIGWYLYLAEMAIREPHKYEFYQSARVLPVLIRMGLDFSLLTSIGNITFTVKKLINQRKSEADAIFFEILTALVWARNGWKVAFLEESKSGKTPDLTARKGNEEWYIECKRQSKSSDYSLRERLKWQNIISQINKQLLKHNMLLEVVFHIELTSLPDTYLKDLLYAKIPLIVKEGKVLSTNEVDVSVSFINIDSINKHVSKFVVKNDSPVMAALIGGKPTYNLGFTSGMEAGFYRVGEGTVNNLYVNAVRRAFGAFWSCDAPEAIFAKARDIKKQIFSALQQFRPEHNGVVHVGMETFDGPAVEKARFQKITDTVGQIGLEGKNLKWAYCHFFQAYSPTHTNWTFDETVNTISSNPPYGSPPLTSKFLIVPEDVGIDNLNHWERPLP